MLKNAGVLFFRQPADIDESGIKAEGRSRGFKSEQVALGLAEEKARYISSSRRDALVIGSDQILECQGDWFDKPANRTEAVRTLQRLRNRRHELVSAVTVMRDNVCLWRFVDTARLTMRPFGDDFLCHYLETAGDGILASVGAYRIEGMGIQLFSHIEGDHFTILGMPLLPLLEFLRQWHVLKS